MSAVEVLQAWLKKDKELDFDKCRCPFHTFTMGERNSLEEALLALEQRNEFMKEFSILQNRFYEYNTDETKQDYIECLEKLIMNVFWKKRK